MLLARTLQPDLPLFLDDIRRDHGIACGAETLCTFDEHPCPPGIGICQEPQWSNFNVGICCLLQVLECYIISIEFFIIPLLSAFWIMLPAYLPNPVAAIFGGGTPIDLGKNFSDGKRVLGDGKTYRGLIFGNFGRYRHRTGSDRTFWNLPVWRPSLNIRLCQSFSLRQEHSSEICARVFLNGDWEKKGGKMANR